MPKPYAFINDEMLNYVYLRDHLAGLPIGGRAKFDQLMRIFSTKSSCPDKS